MEKRERNVEVEGGRPGLWPWAAVLATGAVAAPMLFGFAPLAGDPELMYLPIKVELARALAAGRLPFWSERMGLGVPLLAESHVAALYPFNWAFYRIWGVLAAYNLAHWLHWTALAGSTYALARQLGIGAAGAALSAVAFSLCGFQAAHAMHEPFYTLMPYLPLCLFLAERYLATGRVWCLAALALAWGVQVTLGHFQIQAWTAGLVVFLGAFRAVWPVPPEEDGAAAPAEKGDRAKARARARGRARAPSLSLSLARSAAFRRWGRAAALGAAVFWGAAIAWAQLRLTLELKGVTGFDRPEEFLGNYAFPVAHLAQFVAPAVYLGRPFGAGEEYWARYRTTSGEACAYVGTVALALAVVGWFAAPRGQRSQRLLAPWRWVVVWSLLLATMPNWWRPGFEFLMALLPTAARFRAPSRYTLLASLGLALLAGRGLDRTIAPRRFWGALGLAVLLAAAGAAWSAHLAAAPAFQAGLGRSTLSARFLATGAAWALGLAAIVGWRRGRLGGWAPWTVAVLELAPLVFLGQAAWVMSPRLPESSPVLRRLAALGDAGPIGGRLGNLPVWAGRTAAFPYLGITPPPPNYLLEAATRPPSETRDPFLRDAEQMWLTRFGVNYGVWSARDDLTGKRAIATLDDPVLDRIVRSGPRGVGPGPWRLTRDAHALPLAWAATQTRRARSWGHLYSELSGGDRVDEAWFLPADRPPTFHSPGATRARVISSARGDETARPASAIEIDVEHDGPVVLVVRQTYYPGWIYRIDGGPERPVLKVNGGLTGVPIDGAGTHHVSLRYRPTGWASAAIVSLAAVCCSLLVIGYWLVFSFQFSVFSFQFSVFRT